MKCHPANVGTWRSHKVPTILRRVRLILTLWHLTKDNEADKSHTEKPQKESGFPEIITVSVEGEKEGMAAVIIIPLFKKLS